jgi:hypothetical protein
LIEECPFEEFDTPDTIPHEITDNSIKLKGISEELQRKLK